MFKVRPVHEAIVVAVALAVLLTWPLALDPTGSLLGHPGNDVWNHVWGYWWVAEELGAGRLPTRTDLMNMPDGGRLFFIDTFGALASLPIQLLVGPVAAYNAVMVGSFVVAALGAWALARHVVRTARGDAPAVDQAAVFAGVAYASSPHLIAQAYNGITETMFAAGLPIATLAVLRLTERPTVLRALAAGTAVALCVLANWYYGLFAVIGSAILLVSAAVARRERIHWAALPTRLAGAVAITAALVTPVLMGFAASIDEQDALVRRDPAFVWQSLVTHNITDLVSVFRPGRVYSPDLKALHGEDLLIVTYVGWALTTGALWGLFRMRRWRDRLPWMAWILVFFVLMLGPYLNIGGEYVTVADRRIPLPFLALYDAIPAFQRISHPFRFVVPVQLGLAVLAARGLADAPPVLRILAPLVVVFEVCRLSPAPWPIARSDASVPTYVSALAEGPPGGVIDLPITVPNLERAVYLYWQTRHGRPSPYTLNEPLPGLLARSHLARVLLVAEAGRLDSLPPVLPHLDLVVSARALGEVGVRYVVVHEPLYPPDRLATTLTILRTALGPELVRTDDHRRIWSVAPPARSEEGAE